MAFWEFLVGLGEVGIAVLVFLLMVAGAIWARFVGACNFLAKRRAAKLAAIEKQKQDAVAARFTVQPEPESNARTMIGRDKELVRLGEALARGGKAQVTGKAVVQGTGGLGKSTLARAFMAQAKGYDHRLWVDAETLAGAVEDLLVCGKTVFGEPIAEPQTQAAAEAIRNKICQSGQRWLVVFDNVWAFDQIKPLIPEAAGVDVIVTTRDQGGYPGYEPLALGVLGFEAEDGAAVQLLMDVAGRGGDAAGARDLAADLGGLPLALVIAGTLIAAEGGSYASYRARLVEVIAAAPEVGGDYPDSLLGAVELSHRALPPEAQLVVELCAWWAADGLVPELIFEAPKGERWDAVKEDVPEEIATLAQDAALVRSGFRLATARSVLERREDDAGVVTWALHRMTAAALRAGVASARGSAAAALLSARYPGGKRSVTLRDNWPDCRQLTPHARGVWATGQAPATAAMDTLMNQCGVFLETQGDSAGGLDCYRASHDLKVARLPEDDANVPLAKGNLSGSLADAGLVADALGVIAQAVRLERKYRPGTAAQADRFMHASDVRNACHRQGQAGALAKSARWIQRALGLREALEGLGSPSAAHCWSNMAWVRSQGGDHAGALAAGVQAVAIFLRALPGERGTAISTMNLGVSCLRAGAVAEGEGLLRAARAMQEALHPDNPEIAERVHAARWHVLALLARARIGAGPTWEARAAMICNAYGFDLAERKALAAKAPLAPQIALPEGLAALVADAAQGEVGERA